jgi:hypothetical protein
MQPRNIKSNLERATRRDITEDGIIFVLFFSKMEKQFFAFLLSTVSHRGNYEGDNSL